MTRWVADTSPLIFLAKLDQLDLLRKGADEILAPSAVIGEIALFELGPPADEAGHSGSNLGTLGVFCQVTTCRVVL